MLVYNATKRVGEELPMRFSVDRILKIDIWVDKIIQKKKLITFYLDN